MRRTGERYTTAHAELLGASTAVRPLPQDTERPSMSQPSPRVADLFRRFDNAARDIIIKSENFARRDGSATVDPRHILLGVAGVEGLGSQALRVHGHVQPLIDASVIDDAAFAEQPHVPYSTASKKLLEQVLIEAIAETSNVISTQHVLAALMDAGGDEVRSTLEQLDVDMEALRLALPAPDPADRAAALEHVKTWVPPTA